jgi:Uma2 family endonuclease
MVLLTKALSAEAFGRLAASLESADHVLELIAGEVFDVPSNPYVSQIAALISAHIVMFVLAHDLSHVTGEAGGYRVLGERYAPDVALVAKSRQAQLPIEGYYPLAPDLAVEIVSPTDMAETLLRKFTNYLAANTVVWVVRPANHTMERFVPGQALMVLSNEGVIDGGEVLPGFALPVKSIFPPRSDQP